MNYAKTNLFNGAVVLSALSLAGCALNVKNVKPAAPYDFGALRQMAGYAQAAYQDEAAIRAACRSDYEEVFIRTVSSTNNKFFLATSSAAQSQLLAIAGTANLENVLLDADLTQDYDPELRILLHRGFARAARPIYDEVKPRLIPGYRLHITGHSLGGAEALIVGMLLQAAGTPAAGLVTFGQPKVTDRPGLDVFKDLPLTRVVNQDDIIPEVPLNPYRHTAPVLVLFPGPAYSVVEERPLDPAKILAAWQALQNHQPPAELPDHYIANYITNLDSKVTASQLIPYPKAR